MIKLKLSDTYVPSYPNETFDENWDLTFSSRDDIVEVLEIATRHISEFRKKHSNVKTTVQFDTYDGGLEMWLSRAQTDAEKTELKAKIKLDKAKALETRKREVRAEAKKLGLI